METFNIATATKRLYESGLSLFTVKTLRDMFHMPSDDTFYLYIRKLVRLHILEKLERGIYVIKDRQPHEYTIANILHTPSYISFETALNFYGILSQFPYEITSATVGKSIRKSIHDTIYSYAHIQPSLFFGYQKKEGYLIAEPEKALLDQLYFAARGLHQFPVDEYDLSHIDPSHFASYLSRVPKTKQFTHMTKRVSSVLRL